MMNNSNSLYNNPLYNNHPNNSFPKLPHSFRNSFHRYKLTSNNELIIHEQPLFHKEHENRMNAYKHYISTINDKLNANAENFMKYMLQIKQANIQRRNILQRNNLKHSQSSPFIPSLIKSKHCDINNPFYYNDHSQYEDLIKQKQKEYLRYNQEKGYLTDRKNIECDINPYNGRVMDNLGKSMLKNNPILNPIQRFECNPYLFKHSMRESGRNIICDYKYKK